MNWLKVIKKSVFVSLGAFVISSILMLFLNSRVNWAQQATTALIFFIGMTVVYFIMERKADKQISKNRETPENHEQTDI